MATNESTTTSSSSLLDDDRSSDKNTGSLLDDEFSQEILADKASHDVISYDGEPNMIGDLSFWITNDQVEGYKLPNQAKLLYGCINCEWRGTVLCPFKLITKKQATGMNSLICGHRRNYLLMFSRKKRYQYYSDWQNDFNKGLMNLEANKTHTQLQLKRKKLDEYVKDCGGESEVDKEHYKRLKKEIREFRDDWLEVLMFVTKMEDHDVDRKTPKKLEVETSKKMTLSDMHRVMRGDDVIDIDSKQEQDED